MHIANIGECRCLKIMRRGGALVAFWALTVSFVPAQTLPGLSSASRTMPVPLPHLYWHFLILQNHLDRAAAAREAKGEDGSPLHEYYQRKIGFSDAQFAVVREAGIRLEPELKTIDTEVKTIIDADRARHPRVLASPNDLPPPLPELAELQRQREQTIEREVESLRLALGAKQTAKLETFLTKEFARNVTARRVDLPRPHNDPAHQAVPPFPQQEEVQR